MTRQVSRPVENGHNHSHGYGHDSLEADIIAALWEQVPFPRLPLDAPSELKELVVNIENPRKVHAIHRATRRHNLQLLVEKFIVQLRYGCGDSTCSTSSCFSCRKRLAGKTPIRRYSPTSARTLAVYLASQDSPESRLCPHLDAPDRPSDAISPLIFGPKYPTAADTTKPRTLTKKKPIPNGAHTSSRSTTTQKKQKRRSQEDGRHLGSKPPGVESSTSSGSPLQLSISEKEVSKDYRSFAANVFGTVAFKMLEWLTPNSIEAMSEKLETDDHPPTEASQIAMSPTDDGTEKPCAPLTSSLPDVQQQKKTKGLTNGYYGPMSEGIYGGKVEIFSPVKSPEQHDFADTSNHQGLSSHSRRNSNARIRTSSSSKPQAKIIIDPLVDPVTEDSGLVSPGFQTSQPEKVSKSRVRPSSNIARTASQLSTDNLLDTIPDELILEPNGHGACGNGQRPQVDGINGEEVSSNEEKSHSTATSDEGHDTPASSDLSEPTSELESYLPQSLSRLNLQAVNFICDVLQEDATSERHVFEPPAVNESIKRLSGRLGSWRRKRKSQVPYPQDLKLQWKLFVEQSIFNVLSDPQAVLESFTNGDGAVDSPALWYCMLRLTRVAPSLVFDSLWIALAGIFAPPKSLRSPRSPTAKVFCRPQKSFTNAEAASLMSVCFHALVAAAPVVNDSRLLSDMSRIRSHGLSLTGGGAVIPLYLQYEDAFTDDMALRLARRLLTAIPTRRYFDELAELDIHSDEGAAESDVVETMLSHLEPSTQSQLHLSKTEISVHEKRVPILLLDWARAVMLHEWEGRPDVSGDGPFGGALSLIAAMYQRRQSLLLGDVHFRSEYFGDRLDTIEMPVSWLSFNSTKQKVHLLDYPYIFNPTSLVSYFRAINFSRMSRSYEESSSLQSRINAIIAPDSLVTESHQKNVLQDLLKTPSAKYLILDIGRNTVLRDAFDQLWRREERELMRPLKVHLGEDSGEEGFDSGGVQQEFFRLAVADALNPDYGAFTVDERTRMTWFQPGSLQPEWKFELIGLLMSLAVYNGLTLPITFPKALYYKLLGEPVTELHHIADGWPELANGLTNLLEWNEKDGAVEDIFVLTYEFSTTMLGEPVSRQMESDSSRRTSWPQFSPHPDSESLAASNPPDAPLVTGDNRNAYVSDYIRYLTDVSIAPQFAAFARGFRTCLHPKSLRLLTPVLLQSIVEGAQEVDVSELRRAARYVGWDATHRTVRDFWSIVKRYDERMRRKLLEFVTASDRVPVGGVQNVQFVVQKNGEEEGDAGHLPTAYTCYGTLLLPEYRDKDVLRERLAMALENSQGFGFA